MRQEVLPPPEVVAALFRAASECERVVLAGGGRLWLFGCVSLATLKRVEDGAVEVSLGGWLAVFEYLGLLYLLGALRDPVSAAVLDATRMQRDPSVSFA